MQQQHGADYTPTADDLKRSLDVRSGKKKKRGPAVVPPVEEVRAEGRRALCVVVWGGGGSHGLLWLIGPTGMPTADVHAQSACVIRAGRAVMDPDTPHP